MTGRTVGLGIIAACATALAANASPCAKREDALEVIRQHGETQQSVGIDMMGRLHEVFANVDTGTWSILLSPPGGAFSCLVLAGEGFQRIDAEPVNSDDPA